jgi:hypothetical protein
VSYPQPAFLPPTPALSAPVAATLPIELAVLLVDDDHELCGLMRDFFKPHRVGLDVEHDGRRKSVSAAASRSSC